MKRWVSSRKMTMFTCQTHRNWCLTFAYIGISFLLSAPVRADSMSLARLVAAYPNFLSKYDDQYLYWKDGTRMPLSDGRDDKTFEEKLAHASIKDQLALPYVKGELRRPPAGNDDPGRFRNVAFFDKMYGDCEKQQTQKSLVKIKWLPSSQAQTVSVTSVNGVDKALAAVSAELDHLPQDEKIYAFPSAGTFNCRVVADTGNKSMHAWGVAIDLNTHYSDYWMWRPHQAYRNQIPFKIVEIFERHGFIWGGKWAHYDTMHFEYRPELLH